MIEASTQRLAEYLGTGRRKTAVARVRLCTGDGKILINERPLEDFFRIERDRNTVLSPLKATDQLGKVALTVRVTGGGPTGQADAIRLGIARALKSYNTELEPALRERHLLTRDSRKKERKKYGLHGARRGTQFSKR
jgi:small subunit ribosomal protein S9